jgi:hypothetical protein
MGSCDWALGSLTAGHSWSPTRGVRGCDSAERPPADKAPALFPHLARKPESGSQSARSRPRAVKRVAVGGRMTARWSGVAIEPQSARSCTLRQGAQNAPVSRAISKSNAGGFPTADRRAVSRGDVSTWVLVTRNVGCRNGFEASWRCVQGKAARPHEAQSRAMAQGLTTLCRAQGLNNLVSDEIDVPDGARRPSSSQKGARAGKGRKIGARPSVTGPALKPLARDRA